MRKFFIVLLVLSLSLTALGKTRFGIVGGYTSAKMSLSETLKDFDISSAPGFHAGVGLNVPLPLGFGIQPQFQYSRKSSTVEDISKYTVQYLELPVQVQWGVDLIVAKPYVFVEPFVGYTLSGRVEYPEIQTRQELKLDNHLEYGLSVGAGVMIAHHVQLAFKYFWNFDNCGLSDAKTVITDYFTGNKKFGGLAITAGFFF